MHHTSHRLATLAITIGLVLVTLDARAQTPSHTAAPAESTAEMCVDRLDNDGDGATDCDDADCALFVFCSQSSGLPGLPGASTPHRRAEPLAGALAVLSLGIEMSRYGGAGIDLGLAVGASRHYLHLAGRFHAGAQFKDGDPWFRAAGEVGYRGIYRFPNGVAPISLLTAGYAFDWQQDLYTIESYVPQGDVFLWHTAYGRLGTGVTFGRGARFNTGLEISGAWGWSFHANADENRWGEVYDRFYWAVDARWIVTF